MAKRSNETLAIPQIDLGDMLTIDDFRQAAIEQKKQLGRAVVDAFHQVGFIFVRAPRELNEKREAMYDEWAKVFAESSDVKQEWWGGHHKFQRGWTDVDTELGLFCSRSLVRNPQGDDERQPVFNRAENWFTAPEGLENAEFNPEHAINFLPNVWPDSVPNLQRTATGELVIKDATTGVHQDLLAMDKSTMEATEPFLGLDSGYWAYRNDPAHSPSLLRNLYYHPVHKADFERGAVVGACQHTDINDRTWLPTSRSFGPGRGLEVRTRWGEWISGKAPAGFVILQTGDMIQHTTGDYFISAQHRVIPPFIEDGNTIGRYSSALFIHPRPETDLGDQITTIPHPDYNPNLPVSSSNPRFFVPKHYENRDANFKLNERLDKIFSKTESND